jgi:hypothetical protein
VSQPSHEQAAPSQAGKRRRGLAWGGAGVAVVAAAAGITRATVGGGAAAGSTVGYEGVPVPNAAPLASTATMATGQTVDGISCESHEHLLFHVHAHLTIFVNGAERQVPAGVGIPGAKETQSPKGRYIDEGKCFYWLHTHAPDGVIHIESPIQRGFTLGDFFDEWGQPLNADQLGPEKGHVTAFYDGKVYQGNPRDLPLVDRAQIQLEVGAPRVAPELITLPKDL